MELHKDIDKAQIINERLLDQIKFKNKELKRSKIQRNILAGRACPTTGNLDPDVNLDLTEVDTFGAPSVMEKQAEITFQTDRFLLRDLTGEEGTAVNLKKLKPNQPVALQHGDHVSFGDVKLVFVWDGRNPPRA